MSEPTLPATLPFVERLLDLVPAKALASDDYFAKVLKDYAASAIAERDARIAELRSLVDGAMGIVEIWQPASSEVWS